MTDNLIPGQTSLFHITASEEQDRIVEPQQSDDVQNEETGIDDAAESDMLDLEQLTVIDGQLSFVDPDEWWKEHWWGMPEFVQEDAKPWKSMYVHFRNRDDLIEFAQLIGQRLTSDTPSAWYPVMPKEKRLHMGYVDES